MLIGAGLDKYAFIPASPGTTVSQSFTLQVYINVNSSATQFIPYFLYDLEVGGRSNAIFVVSGIYVLLSGMDGQGKHLYFFTIPTRAVSQSKSAIWSFLAEFLPPKSLTAWCKVFWEDQVQKVSLMLNEINRGLCYWLYYSSIRQESLSKIRLHNIELDWTLIYTFTFTSRQLLVFICHVAECVYHQILNNYLADNLDRNERLVQKNSFLLS